MPTMTKTSSPLAMENSHGADGFRDDNYHDSDSESINSMPGLEDQSVEEGYRGDDSSVAGTESTAISTVLLVHSSDMVDDMDELKISTESTAGTSNFARHLGAQKFILDGNIPQWLGNWNIHNQASRYAVPTVSPSATPTASPTTSPSLSTTNRFAYPTETPSVSPIN